MGYYFQEKSPTIREAAGKTQLPDLFRVDVVLKKKLSSFFRPIESNIGEVHQSAARQSSYSPFLILRFIKANSGRTGFPMEVQMTQKGLLVCLL
jgi:hypothetical protein